ncbi:MAG: penicillin-binding protein 2 [Phycisphaerales bacterium]|nr:MAG: penicillin-binding protein 2 [Phycisphaerales bacterium]
MSFQTMPLDQVQRRSCAVLLVGSIALLVALAARLAYINTTLRPRLVAIANRQQQGQSVIPARRGMIFDARGRVVALDRQVPDVFVDPTLVDDVDRLAAKLGPRVNLPARTIAERIRRRADSRFVLIAPGVDAITAEAVRSMDCAAVGLTERSRRSYPHGESLSHVLGWVGRDGQGMEGIELAYDTHLRGRSGRRTMIRDARRRALGRSGQLPVSPVDGGHLVLTIDAEIQLIAEEALATGVRRFEAEGGSAIVMSPKDGSVLAMVCVPTFDPNEPVTAESAAARRNRAVTDPVEPGSSFKPIIACRALEDGFVSTTERIDCHMGSHRFGRRLVKDTSPQGLLDIRGIITRSSNIGMGLIAERMGNEVLHDTLRRFGLGDRTGIDCPGESSGVVYPLHRWTSYSPTSLAMGYEVLVTPLQLINAFAAIVNDGILMRPRLVRELLGPRGEVIRSLDGPQIVRRVVSSQVARYMAQDLLVSVVENGSGRRANTGPYRALGKTGTAKLVYDDRGGYEPGSYLSVFVGAAPVADPQIVVLVMVRRPNPRIGYYGAAVAAPVVGEIIKQTLAYLEVPPEAKSGLASL